MFLYSELWAVVWKCACIPHIPHTNCVFENFGRLSRRKDPFVELFSFLKVIIITTERISTFPNILSACVGLFISLSAHKKFNFHKVNSLLTHLCFSPNLILFVFPLRIKSPPPPHPTFWYYSPQKQSISFSFYLLSFLIYHRL